MGRSTETVWLRGATITLWFAGAVLSGSSCKDDDMAGPTPPEAIGLEITATQALLFSQVGAGFGRTCGVTLSSGAYCWGSNVQGELGDGTTTRRLTPVAVAGGLQFRQVSAGAHHTCGVTTDDHGYCWGDNQFGELGDGTTSINSLTPVAVAGGLRFRQIRAGGLHTCGVTVDDRAYCWGKNDGHQLGIGDATPSEQRTPVAVITGLRFRQVFAGTEHTCGLTTDGRVYCWGYNHHGQLGDGTTAIRRTPVAVVGGLVFRAVSTTSDYTCGVTSGNRAYCWGFNLNGQLGDGTTTSRWRPVKVAGGHNFFQVSTGEGHTCAINPFNRAFCWGWNGAGNLGDGTTTQRLVPVRVTGGLQFRQVSAAYNHTCGVTTENQAYCWGYNNFSGQLGDGTLKNRLRPVPVAGSS
jgi:alpha-tubulin suppressor-like RCC1 family protein